jgi:hypothetical protein
LNSLVPYFTSGNQTANSGVATGVISFNPQTLTTNFQIQNASAGTFTANLFFCTPTLIASTPQESSVAYCDTVVVGMTSGIINIIINLKFAVDPNQVVWFAQNGDCSSGMIHHL